MADWSRYILTPAATARPTRTRNWEARIVGLCAMMIAHGSTVSSCQGHDTLIPYTQYQHSGRCRRLQWNRVCVWPNRMREILQHARD